jgi:hypothetical protein
LAAFGFFGRKLGESCRPVFVKEWEDEEELDLPPDAEDKLEACGRRDARPSAENGRSEGDATGAAPLGNLRKVPEAPYHPSLRPAGIRELRRREREREQELEDDSTPERPHPTLFQPHQRYVNVEGKDGIQERLFSRPTGGSNAREAPVAQGSSWASASGMSSSMTTDPEVPRPSEGTRGWWDGLGDRRSSEVRYELGSGASEGLDMGEEAD